MITLQIDGSLQELDVPADMPLLWIFRDVVGMNEVRLRDGTVRTLHRHEIHETGKAGTRSESK